MHIDIEGDESIDQQTRTYAEYRLFATLAPSIGTTPLKRASLVLRRAKGQRRGARIVCTVGVELEDGAVSRFRAAGDHPYQAINRAIECVRLRSWPLPPGRQAG